MRYSNSVWDDPDLVKELRKLAALKVHTAARLATLLNKKFNTTLTRNAVIGKSLRCGIALPARKPAQTAKQATPRSRVPTSPRLPREPRRDLEAPEPRGDVDGGCRWIHGLAEHRLFCGAPTGSFSASWCEYHAAKVFNPVAPSKTRKFLKGFVRRAA